MARFVRILDSSGIVRLVNAARVVLVDPPGPSGSQCCRLWLDEAMGNVWIDTRLPFDEIAALLNGEGAS